VFDVHEWTVQCADEYEWLTNAKAQQFALTVTSFGLLYRDEPERNN
jgi:hypothetical protein